MQQVFDQVRKTGSAGQGAFRRDNANIHELILEPVEQRELWLDLTGKFRNIDKVQKYFCAGQAGETWKLRNPEK